MHRLSGSSQYTALAKGYWARAVATRKVEAIIIGHVKKNRYKDFLICAKLFPMHEAYNSFFLPKMLLPSRKWESMCPVTAAWKTGPSLRV